MNRKSKPRELARSFHVDGKEIIPKDITDMKQLPKTYLGVSEDWSAKVGMWEEKLPVRGIKLKHPYKLYRLTRITKSVEYYLEAEEFV